MQKAVCHTLIMLEANFCKILRAENYWFFVQNPHNYYEEMLNKTENPYFGYKK